MPTLYIHAINSEFRSRDGGSEYDRPEDALTEAIQSAAAMAIDEIHKGKATAAIEVRVEQADGTPLLRSVVSMSVSALMPLIESRLPSLTGS
ncbi:DUF6894 family protein [Sphingomonas nostoxanthinifaciens]|uniref:DUF6894 family protein n=1 Tax=Sphingomonas nostoxanthinifaciens TaxID=2872652 RepID=UPI001CC21384|nr:hypothetical protein [Sphingomonas nostoxanthinifaciens]UAK25511.1 hypothetical protein K8P63_04930 [Sphingomonas nostoxanthinifaciens]